MGGNLEYRAGNYISRVDLKESKKGLISEELLQKARGISSDDIHIILKCRENNIINELALILTRIEGDNHPTGGYPWLCSDLQNIQPADQVQKKALPLKKTAASPQCLWYSSLFCTFSSAWHLKILNSHIMVYAFILGPISPIAGSIDLFQLLLQDQPLPRGIFSLYKTFINRA
jgi:hypothetical protein